MSIQTDNLDLHQQEIAEYLAGLSREELYELYIKYIADQRYSDIRDLISLEVANRLKPTQEVLHR